MEAILHELVQFHGELNTNASLEGELSAKATLNAELTTAMPLPYYNGEYKVVPDFEGTTLQTKGKSMEKDVIVDPIHVSSTINISGGNTVYIGGDIING